MRAPPVLHIGLLLFWPRPFPAHVSLAPPLPRATAVPAWLLRFLVDHGLCGDSTPVSRLLLTVPGVGNDGSSFPPRTLSRPSHCGIHSTIYNFQNLDYVPWQRSKQKSKSPTLPPILQTRGHQKSKTKTLTSVLPGLHSKPTTSMTSQLRNPQEKYSGRLDSGKTQKKIRLLRALLRNRRTTLQELSSHEVFLTKLNLELIKDIQDMEDSSALKVRTMLQEQDILQTVVDILEYSNKKKLQKLKCELKEWEEKEESKMKSLAQQVEQLNAKIEKTYKEVSFLSTYMDHEYPVKLVQIASLVRQLQQIKDNQQDELDDLGEMRRMVLQSLSNQIQKKKKKLLQALVVKSQQPHQEALLQKTRDNQDLLKYMDKFREFINQFEEEIPILKAEVEQLHVQVQEPREIVFADVLLRRPKCTPDMDVILNIPVEELLPF
ncbi:uncharacterized protein C20orf96 homolog isoform X1 [Mustela lutreola]|uniref:uncharacterized protein C20orf96 homolog isoform X1 n=2 Tax=Mustela lutreola TaxID=9666 RepID=UPI002797A954|nr:uncharacterized protein C20orf96 homolog isoform X1 [Mustela lutreola]